MDLLRKIGKRTYFLYYYLYVPKDPRMSEMPMMKKPWILTGCIFGYIFLTKYLGPLLMNGRKPYNVRKALLFYNFFQILLSAYLFKEALLSGWWNDYDLRCQPIDLTNSPKAKRMLFAVWLYHVSKLLDLLDTVFFVLTKKFSHISNLHIIHHSTMALGTWVGGSVYPGGHLTLGGVINCLVHVIMYTYYFIAALGPEYRKYIWWKKHLTAIQLIQFIIVVFHTGQLLFNGCPIPKFYTTWILFQDCFFLVLFIRFFIKEYVAPNKSRVIRNGACTKPLDNILENNNSVDITEENNNTVDCTEKNGTLTNGKVKLT